MAVLLGVFIDSLIIFRMKDSLNNVAVFILGSISGSILKPHRAAHMCL